jgi:anti-anti-sigma regulatory factor
MRIDISNLRYINSSGIGVLDNHSYKIQEQRMEKYYLMNPSESVQ